MSNFNFILKKESYDSLIKYLNNYLRNDEISNALLVLDKAITLANELAVNTQIVELKNKYMKESESLLNLKKSLENNKNPLKVKTSNGIVKKEEKSVVKYFKNDVPNVKLENIAGLDEVKEQILLNVITPLKDPELYFNYCDSLGSRILMYGPPGCGKSFVAEAIAGELECSYAVINCKDILDKYVGEAPKKIEEIFLEADDYEHCLIFFDELDMLFASRESDDSRHTKDILATFLTCLSGFGKHQDKSKLKVIIGATNRPWALDSALLRGERFDTQIYVGLPDFNARKFLINQSFKEHQNLINDSDITIEEMANKLDGFSGADIKTIIEKAKKLVLKRAINNKNKNLLKTELFTNQDFIQILETYRNPLSKESLELFESFKKGEL